jgi:hypothetical protein
MAQDNAAGATQAGARPAPTEEVRPLEAPAFYASTMFAYFAGNDFTLTFSRPQPGATPNGAVHRGVAIGVPVAVLQMSAATAKDLYLVMKDQIEKYEKEWGEIKTDYARRIAEQSKK